MSLWPVVALVSVWSVLACGLVALRWVLLPKEREEVAELRKKLARAQERAEALTPQKGQRAGPPFSFAGPG